MCCMDVASSQNAARPGYDPGLDGVRALAVIAVLLYHDGRLAGGFLGVSVFFTLSGYLITRLLLAEHERRDRIALRSFFARRARRLLPASLLAVLLAGWVTYLGGATQQMRGFRADALSAVGYVANWRFMVSGQSYAAQFAQPSALLHFWSLAVEEQFYLVLAPLLVLLLVVVRRRLHLGLVLAGLISAAFVVGTQVSFNHAYYGTDVRAAEFLVGSLLAVCYRRGRLPRRLSRVCAAAGCAALGLLVVADVHTSITNPSLFRGLLLGHALCVALVLVAACEPGPLRSLLSTTPLRAVGIISYGLYVYHWPLFLYLTPVRTGLDGWSLTAVRLLATGLVATVSFVLVERPIREGRFLTGFRVRVAVPAVATASVVVFALVVSASAAAPSVIFAPAAHIPLPATPTPARSTPPSTSTKSARLPVPARRILIVGDSVALTLGRGIERWGARRGDVVQNMGVLGCTLVHDAQQRGYWGVRSLGHDPCSFQKAVRQWVAFHPDVILVLFGAWEVYDASWDRGASWNAPGSPAWAAHYGADLDQFAHLLKTTGATVLWLLPPCFAPGPNSPADPNSPWYSPARIVAVDTAYRALAVRQGFLTTDAVKKTSCPVRFDVQLDGTHYSDASADLTTTFLAPDLEHALATHTRQ